MNKEQSRAARAQRGVSLVIAGAGTGKTTTMIARARAQIESNLCTAEKTTILTFSKRAASEISARLAASGIHGITASTFHASSLSLLRRFAPEFLAAKGYSEFPRLCEGDAGDKIMHEILHEHKKDLLGLPLSTASSLVRKNIVPDSLLAARGLLDIITRCRESFARAKRERNLIEYEQLVDYAVDLLSNNRVVSEWAADTVSFLCVDEFQDTSDNNAAYIMHLARRCRNIFMVGDDWQSIYGFRNANIAYIVNPQKYFKNVRRWYLTTNYRSKREIVDIAWRCIRHNRFRTNKRIHAHAGKGGSVVIHTVETQEDEYSLVRAILGNEGNEADCAILYRNNRTGKSLRDAVDCGGVQCMTMHASKGLEFERVIIMGIKCGELPSPLSPIEEERRLLYVALSRAKSVLHIICYEGGLESLFLKELLGKRE